MGTGQACRGRDGAYDGGHPGALRTRLLRGLRDALLQFTSELRDGFGRPAMNRRILHRLALMDEAELSQLGLTSQDVREAGTQEFADVAAFLTARRARRGQMLAFRSRP